MKEHELSLEEMESLLLMEESRKPKSMMTIVNPYIGLAQAMFPQKVEQVIREGKKISRNEPCPCGSGLKFKKCCLKNLKP